MHDLIGRRHALAMWAAAAASPLLSVTAAQAAGQALRPSGLRTKTYVLVYASPSGGWQFAPVAERLRALGHRVFTPSLVGSAIAGGERPPHGSIAVHRFVDEVADLFEAEDLRDVILVGHSLGAIPITAVADRVPRRIRHVVSLEAAIAPGGPGREDWDWAGTTSSDCTQDAAPDRCAWVLAAID